MGGRTLQKENSLKFQLEKVYAGPQTAPQAIGDQFGD